MRITSGLRRIVDAVADAGDLDPSLDRARATDILWTLDSPEVHHQFTVDRGWSNDDYRIWLTNTLQAVLLRRPPTSESNTCRSEDAPPQASAG